MRYAGLWKRFCAIWVDSIIMTICMYVFMYFTIGHIFIIAGNNTMMLINILSIITGWIYYAVMESLRFQGTLGKMAAGIKVSDLEGNRIGFARATGRHFGKFISMLILMIGFLMVPFTKKKQGLHDMMAGCLVVRK